MGKKKIAITKDERNVNQHDERSLAAVEKSLEDLGAGRSIVVDKHGKIIGGEATYEAAQKLGIDIEVIKTTGDKLIVVQREDLDSDDPRRRALAIADNQTGTLSGFDYDLLTAELKELDDELSLGDVEIDMSAMGFDDIELESYLLEDPDAIVKPVSDDDDEENENKQTKSTETKTETKKTEAASGNADQARAGLQGDGTTVYFGQDQFEIIERLIAMAHAKQGDEASDSECVIWACLQVLGTQNEF